MVPLKKKNGSLKPENGKLSLSLQSKLHLSSLLYVSIQWVKIEVLPKFKRTSLLMLYIDIGSTGKNLKKQNFLLIEMLLLDSRRKILKFSLKNI